MGGAQQGLSWETSREKARFGKQRWCTYLITYVGKLLLCFAHVYFAPLGDKKYSVCVWYNNLIRFALDWITGAQPRRYPAQTAQPQVGRGHCHGQQVGNERVGIVGRPPPLIFSLEHWMPRPASMIATCMLSLSARSYLSHDTLRHWIYQELWSQMCKLRMFDHENLNSTSYWYWLKKNWALAINNSLCLRICFVITMSLQDYVLPIFVLCPWWTKRILQLNNCIRSDHPDAESKKSVQQGGHLRIKRRTRALTKFTVGAPLSAHLP